MTHRSVAARDRRAGRYDPGTEQPPPIERIGVLRWLRDNLFGGWANTLLSLSLLALLVLFIPPLVRWALLDSVWLATDSTACAAASGACWAVVREKHRVMLFGFYPFDEHWRVAVALLVYAATVVVSAVPACWRWRLLLPLWLCATTAVLTLLHGGAWGMPVIGTTHWGGLTLTMIVFTGQVVISTPLAVMLALGRRSRLRVLSTLCMLVIESVRATPPVVILFCAAVMLPLFLPSGLTLDKLVRIVAGMGFYFACLQAEVIRGGLQAIPKGQYEAAEALGLRYWPRMLLVVLPQVFRTVLPGLMNHVIQAFKNSTFVIVVGLFDILNATSAAVSDPNWMAYYTEAYLFVALLYFCGASTLSAYSRFLERRLSLGHTAAT